MVFQEKISEGYHPPKQMTENRLNHHAHPLKHQLIPQQFRAFGLFSFTTTLHAGTPDQPPQGVINEGQRAPENQSSAVPNHRGRLVLK